MKKFVLLLFVCLATLTVSAEHLKFKGIPLTGTISQFTAKLKAQGVTISPNNKTAGPGFRWFIGTFYGQKADIYAYYNTTSKIVYRAKACIQNTEMEILENVFSQISESISNKYGVYGIDSTEYGYPSKVFYLANGAIALYYSDSNYLITTRYVLHIDYTDYENNSKNQKTLDSDI